MCGTATELQKPISGNTAQRAGAHTWGNSERETCLWGHGLNIWIVFELAPALVCHLRQEANHVHVSVSPSGFLEVQVPALIDRDVLHSVPWAADVSWQAPRILLAQQ